MSPLPLTVLAQFALSCPTAPSFPPGHVVDRVAATAQAESALVTTALHDNTTDRSYAPENSVEAATHVAALHLQGHSLDAGIMQVNDANWARLGLTAETVFDPCANICAGMAVLAEAYAVERRVSCRYNTGRPDCANGYPETIDGALRHVRAEMAMAPPASLSVQQPSIRPTLPSNPFVSHAPAAREMTFAPSFLVAAPPHDGLRPTEPAVPASPLAAASSGRREFVSLRSSNQ